MKKLILLLMFLSLSAFADKDKECRGDPHHCHGDDSGPPIEIDVDAGADADASSEAHAESSSDATAEASGTQNVNIDSRRPGSSFIGGGDSTASDQKVFAVSGGWLTGNASFRFDITDKDARKLRIARDWKADGYAAELVNKMQCSAKIVYKPFGSKEKCEVALKVPETVPTGNVTITEDEYHGLLVAQVQQEELDEAIEQAEYRYEQQQVEIDYLEEERAKDDAEIKELKQREAKESARRAAARAALEDKGSE